LFKSVLRENDIVCRWGGEEFFILLRDCSREDALVLAQKLRRILASQPLLPTHPQLQVTFSLGLVEHRGGETLAQLFDRADKALYQAKSAGRDRIEVA
jgi:diguanylate cyclase (GGDEF)-like protein